MKFSIGYQLPDEFDSITEIVQDFHNSISEVYFAWPGEASGRTPVGFMESSNTEEYKSIMEKELLTVKQHGIKLVLLFNSNCYGGDAISVGLQDRVIALVSELDGKLGLDAITTTSPFIARTIKEHFSHISVRASVNMRIGTIKGMEYVADCFDGFYMQREYNRNFARIYLLHDWCEKHNKTLHMLANSGCMSFCSNQTFHDNMVAHEAQIYTNQNVLTKYPSPCWDYMENKKNWVSFLQNSWVRPEDISHYEPYFSTIKLATRMHANPRKVISAYSRGLFKGNLLDLTEPGYSQLFKDCILDNRLFPKDWFETTSKCTKQCESCNYCADVLSKILVNIKDLESQFVQ